MRVVMTLSPNGQQLPLDRVVAAVLILAACLLVTVGMIIWAVRSTKRRNPDIYRDKDG